VTPIRETALYTHTVERSRFVAVLAPLGSPEEIDALLKIRRSEVRRANHHCWAIRLAAAAPGRGGGGGGWGSGA
jgi:putative IMPACT (imprinted ancient) family translation regulator